MDKSQLPKLPGKAQNKDERKARKTLWFEEEAKPPEKKSKHEIDFGDKEKGGIGCNPFNLGCRYLGVGCLVLILGLAILLVTIINQRPPDIINPVKTWLNNKIVAIEHDGTTIGGTYNSLQNQINGFTSLGENSIKLNNNQLKALIDYSILNQENSSLNVDISESRIRLYSNIDTPDQPLWLVAEFIPTPDGSLEVTKIGFGRFGLPSILNSAANNLLSSLNNIGNQISQTQLINTALKLPENIAINKIELGNQEVIVTLNISTGLENIFTL